LSSKCLYSQIEHRIQIVPENNITPNGVTLKSSIIKNEANETHTTIPLFFDSIVNIKTARIILILESG